MRFLSIQSSVVHGHVGHAASTFALQRLGHEVWAVPTVVFSNHTGHPSVRGFRLEPAQVTGLVDGLADLGALAECDVVLSGYLGDPALVEVVGSAVERVKAANPAASYACDPVLGDTAQGFFVPPEVADGVRRQLLPLADLATPNVFELEALTGQPVPDLGAAVDAARMLLAAGPRTVLVTSSPPSSAPSGEAVAMAAVTAEGAWATETPLLPVAAHGAGDLTAALFAAHLAESGSAAVALGRTTASVHAVLETMLRTSATELPVVAGQAAIARPEETRFPVRPLDA